MKQSSKKYFEHTCTNCRKSKVRCDRVYPRCGRCIRLDLDCVEQTRARGRPAKKSPGSSTSKIEEDKKSVIASPPPSPPRTVLPIEEHDFWTPIKQRLRPQAPKRVAPSSTGREEVKDEDRYASRRKKRCKKKRHRHRNGGELPEVEGEREREEETDENRWFVHEGVAEHVECIEEEEQKDGKEENWHELGFWEDVVEGLSSPDTRSEDFESTAFPERYMATTIASVFMRLRNAGRLDREKSLCVLRAWSLTGVRMNMHYLVRSIHLMASVLDVEFGHLLSDCQLAKQLRGRYGINTIITETATKTLEPQHADPFINSYFMGGDAALIVISINGLQRTTYNSLFANEYLHDCQDGKGMEVEEEEAAMWGEDDDGKGSLLKRLIIEEADRQDFLTTVGHMIFESPGPFAETSYIFKTRSRSYRSPYLCLAKLRFHISDAGSYYAAVLTLQRLPPCRYMGIAGREEHDNGLESMMDEEEAEADSPREEEQEAHAHTHTHRHTASGSLDSSTGDDMPSSADGTLVTTTPVSTHSHEHAGAFFHSHPSPQPPQIFKFNSASSAHWNCSNLLVAHHHGQEPSSVPPDPPALFQRISSIAPIPSGGKGEGGDKEGKLTPWEGGSFCSVQGGGEEVPDGGGFSRMLQLIRGASELADEFLTL